MTSLNNEALALAHEIAARFDARIASADEKSVANLLDARKKCVAGDAVKFMLAIDFNIDSIDGRNGAEHNVHMLKHKLHNAVETVNKRDTLNHYTNAIFRTARNLHANGMSLTTHDIACITDADFKVKNGDARQACYVIDREAKKASVSTQKSSSTCLLVNMKVLQRDGAKQFKFCENAVATHLLEVALNLI